MEVVNIVLNIIIGAILTLIAAPWLLDVERKTRK